MILHTAVLSIELPDDITVEEAAEILEWIPAVVMQARERMTTSHPCQKIQEIDIPAVILPRACTDCLNGTHDKNDHEAKLPFS